MVHTQIFSVGLSDSDLEDWPFWSLRKKKKRETSTKRFEELEYLSLMPRVLRGA